MNLVRSLLSAVATLSLAAAQAAGPTASGAPQQPAAQPGGPIQVVDAVGRPVSGVTVLVQPRPDALFPENITETTATVTDAQGKFVPPAGEAGDTYFVLRKPGLESLAMESNRPIPPKVTMRAGRVVTGQVLDNAGQPVAGAVIGPVIHPPTMRCLDHWEHRNPMPRQVLRAAEDGTFRLSALPIEAFAFQVTAPGRTPRVVVVPPGEKDIKVALSSGGAIVTGTVLGSKDRAPQANIPIEATGNNMFLYSYTDAQGTYAFDNMPTGTWIMRPSGGGPRSGTQSRWVVTDIDKPDEAKDVPLVLNQGILLAGSVLDAETSAPLAGINVTLAGYAGKGAKAVFSQPDGSFAFENLDSLQDVLLRFDPVKFVYIMPGGAARDYFDINSAGDVNFDLTTLTLRLHKRLQVKGKVVDTEGQPVADVEIRLQSRDVVTSTPSKSGPGPLEFSTYTNGKGEFNTGVYPAGRYKTWAQQDAMVSQIQNIEAYTTAPTPVLSLRLDQAAQVSGMVTNANDEPVSNAVVIAWPADAAEPEEDPIAGRDTYQYTKSNPKGYFTISGLRGEPMIFRATHPTFVQPAKLPLDPAKAVFMSSDTLKLKFPAGGELAVTVTDDKNQPLSQAEVQVSYHVGLDGKSLTVHTDQFGRANIVAIPANQLERITINHMMFAPYESDGKVTLPSKDLKVQMKRRGSLTVKVTGSSPSPGGLEIYLLQVQGKPADTAPEAGYQQSAHSAVVGGLATFASLSPGWYKAAYANGGAYAESQPVKIEAGAGDKTTDLVLPQGNHVTGIVKDKATGAGIPGANVTLKPAIESDFVNERAQQNTTTGEGGAFEFYNVGSGQLKASVIAAGYPDFEKKLEFTPGESIELELSNAPATLKGRVLSGGAPVDGALVVLYTPGANANPVASAVTESGGAYTLDGFSAGTYLLSVEAPIGTGDNISRKSVNVVIEGDSGTQDVNFEKLVQVSGVAKLEGKTIQRESGQPVSLLFQPKTSGNESKMVNMTEGGKYSIQLEPGDYSVSLEDRPGIPVRVPEGSTQQLNLDF